MARVQLGNRIIEVDDSFLSMSPEDQRSTMDEIEGTLSGAPPAAPPPAPVANATPQLPPEAPPQSGFLPSLKVGTQAVGHGLADIAGAPADLAVGAMNAGAGLVNSAVIDPMEALYNWASGSNVEVPRIPRTPENPLGSESIANTAGAVADTFGADTVGREGMTDFQRLGYDVDRFATQGAGSGVGMMKMAAGKKIADVPKILQPYTGEKVGRVIAGDTAGGAGTGVAMNALEEHIPDEYKGPLTSLLAALAGGVGGNTMLSLAEGLTTGNMARLKAYLPAGKEFQDQETGFMPRNQDADKAAGFIQKMVSDKDAAVNQLDDTINFQGETGGTMPTSGMATNDVGLRYLEKTQALANPQKYQERYEGVAKDASNDVMKLQDENADIYAPKTLAESTIGKRLAEAEGNVTAQDSQLAATLRQVEEDLRKANQSEADVGNVYRPYAGGADAASIDLDKAVVDQTMRPAVEKKNAEYKAAADAPDSEVPADYLLDAIAQIEARAKNQPPSFKSEIIPPVVGDLKKFGKEMVDDPANPGQQMEADKENPTVSFKTLNDMRPVLSSLEKQARTGEKYPLADSYKSLKGASNQASELLAETGGEAGELARTANTNYEKEFAPLFNQGEGGNLRRDINRDDKNRTNTQPTKTAGRFLKEGPGGQEAAADLQRILSSSPAGAEGAAAARRYVLSDLAKLVGSDGKVSEQALQKWINNRQGMLSQVPDLQTEVTGLLRDVRSGAANTARTRTGGQTSTSRIQADLSEAKKNLATTKEDVNKSALSIYLGKDPEHAISSVLSSGDPVGKIKEMRASFAGDVAAERGFRAAAADHLVRSVTNSDGTQVSYAKLAQHFKNNEKVMVELFGEDMKYLRQAQKRLEMLSRKNVQAVAGSGTIENSGLLQKAMKPLEIVLRGRFGALQGGSKIRKYKLIAEQFPDGSAAANDLIARAGLDPELAKHLLTREVEIGTPAWNKKLNQLLGYATYGRESGKSVPENESQDKK